MASLGTSVSSLTESLRQHPWLSPIPWQKPGRLTLQATTHIVLKWLKEVTHLIILR